MLSVALLRHPEGDPRVAGFFDGVDRVHAIAERSDGFVWRFLESETDAAAAAGRPLLGGDARAISSFSVWRTVEDLERFVYHTLHGSFYRRRAEWFEAGETSAHVLWPVASGHVPDIGEALDRLEQLQSEGPSEAAYDFGHWRQKTAQTETA
jgi:hypothetical protein